MIENAQGIILRTRPLTETSLIVHWLTPELGRLATVAKGARRPKSSFAGKLDLFYVADFSFSRSRHSDLHTLREVQLRETHAGIRDDVLKLQQAAYAVNLIAQTTESETPLSEIYKLLAGYLGMLCKNEPQSQSVLALELKLLQELGMEPDISVANLTPGARKIAFALLEGDWPTLSRLKLSEAQSRELRQWLHGFLIYHLGHLPRGRTSALADPK
jgi:DNA repair protein RecO (recombination protein O)